jgi:hypothetical protein
MGNSATRSGPPATEGDGTNPDIDAASWWWSGGGAVGEGVSVGNCEGPETSCVSATPPPTTRAVRHVAIPSIFMIPPLRWFLACPSYLLKTSSELCLPPTAVTLRLQLLVRPPRAKKPSPS